MELLWDWGTEVCSNGPGHTTKMAAMPIYGKNLKKIFFSGIKRPMTLNLGMHHRVLQYYQLCSDDDPGLTLTYFTARSNLVPYAFAWEKGKIVGFSETIVLYDLKLATDDQSDKRFLFTSKLCSLGVCMLLPRGYIHVLNHEKKNVLNQTTKRFLWNLQQIGKVIRPSYWHQYFVPWRLSVPAQGLYTCIKSWRKLYKIRLQRHFFETCNKRMNWQDISVDIKILSPGGSLPLPWGYIHV